MDQEKEIALKVFYNICSAWGLSATERSELLGNPENQLERISYTIGIYKALHTIFTNNKQSDAWIKKPNREFGHQTALEVMIEDPQRVRRYLDAQL